MSRYLGYVIKVLAVAVAVVAVVLIVYTCIKLSPTEVPKALQLVGITAAGLRKTVWIVGGVLLLLILLVCAFGYAYGDTQVASLEANRKAGNLERELAEVRGQLNRMEALLQERGTRGQ
ncbi:MAG: hypothetical protein IKD70_01645 [Eggerthellaceae bacterium]|nr:hypothetical protein [Eggerthellaceae bacterium]